MKILFLIIFLTAGPKIFDMKYVPSMEAAEKAVERYREKETYPASILYEFDVETKEFKQLKKPWNEKDPEYIIMPSRPAYTGDNHSGGPPPAGNGE